MNMNKRNIAVLLAFFFMLLLITVSAQAKSSTIAANSSVKIEDSKNVSAEIVAEITNNIEGEEIDEVFKVYNVGITFAFGLQSDIQSVLTSDEVLGEHYAAKTTDGTYSFWIEHEGSFTPLNVLYFTPQAYAMLQSEEVVHYISDDVIVYNRYFLSGESSHMGTAIYYETNMGDYVYYTESSIGERLFPVEAFCQYQKAVREENQNKGYLIGKIDYSGVWDLSLYDFNADTFNLNAKIPSNSPEAPTRDMIFVGVSVAVILAVAVYICIRKGKEK